MDATQSQQPIDLSGGFVPLPPVQQPAAAPASPTVAARKATAADFMAAVASQPARSSKPLNPSAGGAATSADFMAAAPAQPAIDLSGGFVPNPTPPPVATLGDKLFGRNPISDTASSVGEHLKQAVTIPFHMITDRPADDVEKWINRLGPGMLPGYRFLVAQGHSSEDALGEVVRQVKAGNIAPMNNYDEEGNYHPSAQSSLMDAIPVLGGLNRAFQNEANKKGVLPAVAGLATDILAPEAAVRGVKLAGAVAHLPVDVATGAARAITGTSERATAGMVRNTASANKNAIAAAADKDAANQAAYPQTVSDVETKNQAAREAAVGNAEFEHRQSQQDIDAANQTAQQKHEAATAEVLQDNAAAMAKHAEDTQAIREHNEALQQSAGLRDQTAAELAQKTQSYFDKEAEVKARVKADNDANWETWRDKVAGKPVDMDPINETIAKATTKFPEVGQILRETSFAPEEGSPAMTAFEKDRANIMETQGYKGDYESQSPQMQGKIDDLMEKMGIDRGEGEEFDPESGKPLTIEQLHDLKTQIGWKLFRNEYPPNVTRAMQQVYGSLQRAEGQTSIAAGALDDLLKARESHAAYQEGFGRTKPMRMTEDQMRMRQANPEAFKQQQEQARVDAAAQHEPSLADDYKEVQGLRAKVKSLPTQEKLQQQMRQPPEPPQLSEPPQPPPAAEVDPLTVRIPKTEAIPPPPEPVQPDLDVITPQSLQEAKRNTALDKAGKLADLTQYKIATAAGSTIGILKGLGSLILGSGGGFASSAKWAATGAGVVLGVHLLGRLLESDKVIDALSKPTKEDYAQVMKLPPEQRMGIEKAVQQLNDEAMRQGKLKSISPWLPFLRGLGAVDAAKGQNDKQQTGQQQSVVATR